MKKAIVSLALCQACFGALAQSNPVVAHPGRPSQATLIWPAGTS